jgi:hypothetical protein
MRFMPSRIMVFSTLIVVGFALLALSFRKGGHAGPGIAASSDSLVSQQAFLDVYRVLMSPRCMNCHPAGDVPLQGDDSHLHTQGVKRGPEGRGLYALKCTNCHQSSNTPGLNMPPGVSDWHLPPANMRMVFQGRSAHDLALQMVDPKRNGGKSKQDLIEHMKTDLVRWAWHPGDGRTKPPLSYEEFTARFKDWIEKGAVAPPAGAK